MLALTAVESSRCLHPPADTGACCWPNTVPERWICECRLRHWLAQRRTGKKNGYGAIQQRRKIETEKNKEQNRERQPAAVQRPQLQPAQVAFHMKMLHKLRITAICTNWIAVWTDKVEVWTHCKKHISCSCRVYRHDTLVVSWPSFRKQWDIAKSSNR